jgi:SnoaL-like domain
MALKLPTTLLGLAAASVALPALNATATRFMLRRNLARYKAGDPSPVFRTYADDVHFVLPGKSSRGGEFHGRAQVEPWVRRFLDVGLQLDPNEIVVSGMPWNTRVCIRYTDHYTSPEGERVYENRGVIFGRIAWGKLRYYEVNEDTHKVEEFDRYLAAHPELNSRAS